MRATWKEMMYCKRCKSDVKPLRAPCGHQVCPMCAAAGRPDHTLDSAR